MSATSTQKSPQEVIKDFTDSKDKMVKALRGAQRIIYHELKSQEANLAARLGKGKTVTVLSYMRNTGKGDATNINDRKLFHWNGVDVTDSEEKRGYLIDLFCNEVNRKTCNIQSQIGHFQFAALQPVLPDEDSESPHVEIDGRWYFLEDRLRDSGRSLCDYSNSETSTELKPFDPVELVRDFMDFVVERES